MRFEFHTFGCKVNTYDTGLIQKNLTQLKLNMSSPVHVLNTCAVTSEATKQATKLIRKIKSQNTEALVVVTGCAAQVDTETFVKTPGVDLVVANSHKGLLPQIIEQFYKGNRAERVFKSNIFRQEELGLGGGEEQSHTRSFLKIQDGCNSFCTFCIIPYARGKSRSLPLSYLVDQVQKLAKKGIREVVLTGVHIGDYEDAGRGLEVLVHSLLDQTEMPRFRLTSLEPIEVSEELLKLFQNPRLCPHFHMSIQSADTDVLRMMKRKYTAEQVMESLRRIREIVPASFIGMDVIAGFPTETQEQFENTYRNLADSPWTRLHVFPYSERSGTVAGAMKQIPMAIRKERAALLRSLSLHRLQSEALKQVGHQKRALLLKDGQALTADYWTIEADFRDEDINQERDFKITGVRMNDQRQESLLIGEIL